MPPPLQCAKTSFVQTHFYGQLDCAQVFLDSSAPSLLAPNLAAEAIEHSLKHTESSHVWSMYYACKGWINPNYLSSSLHPPIHLLISPSVQLSPSIFSVFSVTKLEVSAFLEPYCQEMRLEIAYTILLILYKWSARVQILFGIL